MVDRFLQIVFTGKYPFILLIFFLGGGSANLGAVPNLFLSYDFNCLLDFIVCLIFIFFVYFYIFDFKSHSLFALLRGNIPD